jgi:hypothetical protein
MKKTRLKGGSLSGTYLCRPGIGVPFVRKDVSLINNREYGFQRWYSQLKRLQRYEHMFPGVFPKLIGYGRDEDQAYFDIEYIEGTLTVLEFLEQTDNPKLIDEMFAELVVVMDSMHKTELTSSDSSCGLYIYEEIEQKMLACKQNARYQEFTSYPEIIFNGRPIAGLKNILGEYKEMFKQVFKQQKETFTHGNLTLENILYQPKSKKITFIDPYEENIIDSKLAEYSQVLQSSNSLYELYNSSIVNIDGNKITSKIVIPNGLEYFNKSFKSFMSKRLTSNEIRIVKLLEVSQFARMLPFKMEIDEDKMLFFYALGSSLFHDLKLDWSNKKLS